MLCCQVLLTPQPLGTTTLNDLSHTEALPGHLLARQQQEEHWLAQAVTLQSSLAQATIPRLIIRVQVPPSP